jgi:catalase
MRHRPSRSRPATRRVADAFDFDILDPTKFIPEERLPVRPIGRLVLDRTVDNFFAETEQVAFCTQNIVPGVDFTNDPLLRGRNFSYLDTQLKRLGSPNFTHLPINAPKCPWTTTASSGQLRAGTDTPASPTSTFSSSASTTRGGWAKSNRHEPTGRSSE